jgi:hypothetical protein
MKVRIATVQIVISELMTGPALHDLLARMTHHDHGVIDMNVVSITMPVDHPYGNSLLVDERRSEPLRA